LANHDPLLSCFRLAAVSGAESRHLRTLEVAPLRTGCTALAVRPHAAHQIGQVVVVIVCVVIVCVVEHVVVDLLLRPLLLGVVSAGAAVAILCRPLAFVTASMARNNAHDGLLFHDPSGDAASNAEHNTQQNRKLHWMLLPCWLH
jgi:hypothetical protein